ncbi:MAG: DUF1592 domain-containing protein [Myxococcota bacterium]
MVASGCYSGIGGDPGDAPGAEDGAEGGDDGDGDGDGDDGEPNPPRAGGECSKPEGPDAPLRRMTRAQYNNTVAALIGDTTAPAASFAQDEQIGAFASNAIATVSVLAVEQYMDAAETLAATAVEDLDTLLPCTPETMGEDACASEFITDFGRRAYRRPLTADEVSRAQAVFESGRDGATFADGIRLVVQAMLQSPNFLYHFEYGVEGEGPMVAMRPHEVANRLSYFIWGSMPDGTLFEAADAGELETREQIEAQAYRMLADDKAEEAFGSFHRQWLGVHELETIQKDNELFPAWSTALAHAMTTEAERFGSYVIRNDDGRLETLLTANYTVANAELAAFYGAQPPTETDADGFGVVELDPGQRAGVLTQAGWLAEHAHANQTSPVFRGILVREQLLCQPLPQPPDTVNDTPPDIDPDATAKERFEQLLEDPTCATCHIQVNPIGFGFENYDAIGNYREMDGNVAVDAVGELEFTDVDGDFDGAPELAARLAQSELVAKCVAKQWSRFATGRIEQQQDLCALDDIYARFEESDRNIQELIVGIAGSDMMRFIRKAEQ